MPALRVARSMGFAQTCVEGSTGQMQFEYQPPCPMGMHCRTNPSQALDSDKKRLQAPNGQQAARDIVQFCELRPHQV